MTLLRKSSLEIEDLADVVAGAIREAVAPLKARLDALEGKGLSFEGTHQRGQQYRRGQAVVADGSLWIATRATTASPRENGDWALAAKAGKDAR